MIFALIFVVAFLIGLAIYHLKKSWLAAVLIPSTLFTLNVMLYDVASNTKAFSLVFGVPIIFFAALLGCYVYQMRWGEEALDEEGTADEVIKNDNELN